MNIDPSRVHPVPREDIERLKAAIRERVIKPMLERRARQAQLIQQVRQRVVF